MCLDWTVKFSRLIQTASCVMKHKQALRKRSSVPRAGPSLCRPRARPTHARATSGHVLVTWPGLGSHLSGSALWGWCVRGDGNQATDGQTN